MKFVCKIYIYVDDIRNPDMGIIPDGYAWTICRSYKEAIRELTHYMLKGSKIILDLDHDLGGKKTGDDIAKFVATSGYLHLRFKIHSQNPVGAQNMRNRLKDSGFEEI